MIGMIFAGLVTGAEAFRMRGNAAFRAAIGRGAFTARLLWATVMGVFAAVAGAAPFVGLCLGVGFFLGCLLPWYRSLSLGRNPDDGLVVWQYVRHFARGLFWPLPAAVLAAVVPPALEWALGTLPGDAALSLALSSPWWWLSLSGLACVPAYDAALRWFPDYADEVAERAFGAAMGLGVGLIATSI